MGLNEPVFVESLIGPVADEWWKIYDAAFADVNRLSPCRQSFHHDEFMEIMASPLVTKLVITDADGDLMSMGVWTADLTLCPWVSEEYFRHHFPDEYARQVIFYFVALLTRPGHHGLDHMKRLAEGMTTFVAERAGIAALDVCEANGWIPEACVDLGSPFAEIALRELATQRYWAFRASTVTGG